MEIDVWRTPVFEDLERVAGDYAGDTRMTLPYASRQFARWPVGVERWLIAQGLPQFEPEPVADSSARGAAFQFKDRESNQYLLLRPPSELAARLLWRLLDEKTLTVESLGVLSRLLGGPSAIRTVGAATTRSASGHSFRFMPVKHLKKRIEAVIERVLDPTPSLAPLLHATGLWIEMQLIHPFPDGNGRLARLLFLGALHRAARLDKPVYPLGPAVALHREHVLRCFIKWEIEGDPRPTVDFVLETVRSLSKVVLSLKTILSLTKSSQRTSQVS